MNIGMNANLIFAVSLIGYVLGEDELKDF